MVTHTPNQLMSSVLYVAQVWWHTHLINWCHLCCMWPKYGDTHTYSTDVIGAVCAQVWWHTHTYSTDVIGAVCGPSMVTHAPDQLMSPVLYVAQVWWHTHTHTHTPNQLMSSVLYVAQVWWHTHLFNWCHRCCMCPSMVTHTHLFNWCHWCCMWPKYGDTRLINWCHRCCMWPKYGDTHTYSTDVIGAVCAQVWWHTHTYSTDVIGAVCGPSMVTHAPDQLMSPVLYVAQVWWHTHTHLINWCHRCCMWPKYGDTHTYSTDVIGAVCGPSMVTHTPIQLMSSVLYVAQVWWHTHLINWCHRCCMWPKYGDTHT